MAYDGIVAKSVVTELNTYITGGKVNKIFEPNKNQIILGIYNAGKNYALNCSISSDAYRVHLTTASKPNPLNAPRLLYVIKKALNWGKNTQYFNDWLRANNYYQFRVLQRIERFNYEKVGY